MLRHFVENLALLAASSAWPLALVLTVTGSEFQIVGPEYSKLCLLHNSILGFGTYKSSRPGLSTGSSTDKVLVGLDCQLAIAQTKY